MIAALFVQKDGCYYGLPDVDPWPEGRDARKYAGPWPVVAHPPCNLWVNFAAVNWFRYGKTKPAWYQGGDDDGCFSSALNSVRQFGGVLEHPASSHAWVHFNLLRPSSPGWNNTIYDKFAWTCEVWQSASRKRTWLFYFSTVHQCGWFDRNKPTLGKRAASATPPAFRDVLLDIARGARREVM